MLRRLQICCDYGFRGLCQGFRVCWCLRKSGSVDPDNKPCTLPFNGTYVYISPSASSTRVWRTRTRVPLLAGFCFYSQDQRKVSRSQGPQNAPPRLKALRRKKTFPVIKPKNKDHSGIHNRAPKAQTLNPKSLTLNCKSPNPRHGILDPKTSNPRPYILNPKPKSES